MPDMVVRRWSWYTSKPAALSGGLDKNVQINTLHFVMVVFFFNVTLSLNFASTWQRQLPVQFLTTFVYTGEEGCI